MICNKHVVYSSSLSVFQYQLLLCVTIQGRVQRGGSGGWSTPQAKVWHNSQLSSCVTTIVTDKQQLIAKTNNKLTGLAQNGSISLLLGLKQPSLSSSCLQERVNEGCGHRLGGVAKIFARVRLSTYLPQILDTPLYLVYYWSSSFISFYK